MFSALFKSSVVVFWVEKGYTTKKIFMISINYIDIIYKKTALGILIHVS